jgi:hypothetical protein
MQTSTPRLGWHDQPDGHRSVYWDGECGQERDPGVGSVVMAQPAGQRRRGADAGHHRLGRVLTRVLKGVLPEACTKPSSYLPRLQLAHR